MEARKLQPNTCFDLATVGTRAAGACLHPASHSLLQQRLGPGAPLAPRGLPGASL